MLALASAGLCAIPLFNLLGYEFSVAIALLASFASAHLGAVHARASSDPDVARAVVRATLAHMVLLLPPLVVVSLNALRVRNCDYLDGLAFYALLPCGSVLCATAAGVLAALFIRRPRIATAAALAVVLGSIAVGVLRLYLDPPVYAYDPFVGYFPGALYDEDVTVTPALLWYRLMNVAVIAALLLLVAQRPIRAFVALAVSVTLYWQGPRLGFRNTADGIASALGGRHETGHFVIFFRDDGRARDLPAIARDHEFRYAQLEAALGTRPRRKVRSYLFPSAAEKRRLLGAGRTFVAKPWLGEMYLQEGEPPQPALKHELAHIFGAELATGPLGVPRTLDLGLIEGLAVALDWPSEEGLDPHGQVQVLRQARLLPPIDTVLGAGFLGHAPARAYTIAGSFVRHLLDRHGRAPLRRAYASGNVATSYGRTLWALEAEWHKTIDAVSVDELDRAALAERFLRPAIWRKTCAHEIATLSQKADALLASRPREAAEVLRRIVEFDPGEPAHLLALGDALARAQSEAEARRVTERALDHRAASAALRQRALAALGDLAWAAGRTAEATAAYRRAAELPAAEAERRLLALKILATGSPDAQVTLREFLLGPRGGKKDPFVDGVLLSRLVGQMPGEGLPAYLLGRQMVLRSRFPEALTELRRACDAPLPGADFLRECQKLLAAAAWRAGDLDASEAAARGLRRARRDGGDESFALDLINRLGWERRHGRVVSSGP